MDKMWRLTVAEIEVLHALRCAARPEYPTGRTNPEAEASYFRTIDHLARQLGCQPLDIQLELAQREAGYVHEAEGRAGTAPAWR